MYMYIRIEHTYTQVHANFLTPRLYSHIYHTFPLATLLKIDHAVNNMNTFRQT